jgi:hypothetical protein
MTFTVTATRASTAIAGLLSILLLNQAAAQQPTQAQRDAIRSSCRSDFMANCSGVQPGGKDALDCLIQHTAKLSPSCKTAVNAVAPPPAAPAAPVAAESVAPKPAAAPAAPAPAAESQVAAVQHACTLNDFMAYCSWIKPDSPEIVLCLKANAAELSPACRAAVEGSPGAAPAAAKAPMAAPPVAAKPQPVKRPPPAPRTAVVHSPPSAAPAASAPPTAEQQSAIRAACRSDFMARCSGVTPGGAEALQCLKRNAAELSPACRSAVAAVGGGAPATASAPPPAAGAGAAMAPAAPAVQPLVLRPMLPRRRLMLMAICRGDAERLCAGLPPIGPGVLDCLAMKAASLSPTCYEALARASRP